MARDSEVRDALLNKLDAQHLGASASYPHSVIDIDEIRPIINMEKSTAQKGKEVSVKKLKRLSNEAMEEEIPLWGGTKLRKEGLFAYIGEVYHHKGQVTYIRGTHKRLNE